MDAASKRLHASGMSPRFPTPVGLEERGANTRDQLICRSVWVPGSNVAVSYSSRS